jgi:phosphoribosyl 1,2-cyclic phosphate phosphodiesterase
MKVRLLGTGTSTGIPVIGCTCPVCTSSDPRDRRLRCSCYVEAEGVHLVIDTGPDFRQQALTYAIPRVYAVLLTHHHFDHIVGLDDLRPYCFDTEVPIPCYARANTAQVVERMFGYVFGDGSYPGVSNLVLRTVDDAFTVRSRYDPEHHAKVLPIEVDHGTLPMLGFRIGGFAYVTDTNNIPGSSMDLLADLEVLVLDALRDRPHPTHYTIDEAVEVAQRIGARSTFLVHMTHTVSHAETDARLPEGVALAYDGLTLDIRD